MTYKKVVRLLAVNCSDIWVAKQLQYLIDSAYRSGAFRHILEYTDFLRVDPSHPVTPAEFLAAIRMLLYVKAAQMQTV